MTTPADQPIPIYTIGYGARTVEELASCAPGATYCILDRRAHGPLSRYKPDFSKDALETALKSHGIRYLYMGDSLGGRPDDPTCYVDGRVELQPRPARAFYQAGIARIQAAFAQGRHVVLMCSEGKPEACHHAKLIGATLTGLGIPVAHIDENDELCTQAQVQERLDGPQLGLFDEPLSTLRANVIATQPPSRTRTMGQPRTQMKRKKRKRT